MSRLAFDSTIPVTPPIVNKNRNANEYSATVFRCILPANSVANHEKTFIPVGTPITIVAALNYALESVSIPTVYI
jgi:hypothetical protein